MQMMQISRRNLDSHQDQTVHSTPYLNHQQQESNILTEHLITITFHLHRSKLNSISHTLWKIGAFPHKTTATRALFSWLNVLLSLSIYIIPLFFKYPYSYGLEYWTNLHLHIHITGSTSAVQYCKRGSRKSAMVAIKRVWDHWIYTILILTIFFFFALMAQQIWPRKVNTDLYWWNTT